jgi:hypothetical protein
MVEHMPSKGEAIARPFNPQYCQKITIKKGPVISFHLYQDEEEKENVTCTESIDG